MKHFAMTGAAGFVAPRHMKAIANTGHQLVAALDPNDSVGILDSYFPQAQFFTSTERFQRHIEKLRWQDAAGPPVDYFSVCSPNHVHDAHIRMGLRSGADVICEKPLVVSPWNLDLLRRLEDETGRRVYTVLQLRKHPTLVALKERLAQRPREEKTDVTLAYITRRGNWYHVSWKGQPEKSGGLAMNIGIHFFDMLMWLFGPAEAQRLHWLSDTRMAGVLELERARVRWFLSIEADDLPESVRAAGQHAYRSITLDGEEIEFSSGFTDLHTLVYEAVLAGQGYGIDAARPSIELVHQIRTSDVIPHPDDTHPILQNL